MTFPSGFFIIDKPQGVTSFSMVSLVRRLTGVRRVGHAGTLDPLATGVLPVAVGQAARFIEYMDAETKTYVARVRFGEATETYDSEGVVTASGDASHVTVAGITTLLPDFTGEIEQTPPVYSAIKLAGKPLYRYALAGEPVEVRPRRVRIDSITLVGFDAELVEAEIEVVCGKGTYIRSLAHDLGQRLGCGAHLSALRRSSSGGFSLDDAVVPETLSALAGDGRLEDALLALDRAVERRRAAIVAAEHAADVRSGRDVDLQIRADIVPPSQFEICRAYDTDGRFLGVIEHQEGGRWHPAKVVPNV
jgi:tRNA pseudouridine55 synthase